MTTLATETFPGTNGTPWPDPWTITKSAPSQICDVQNGAGRLAPASGWVTATRNDIPTNTENGMTGTFTILSPATNYVNGSLQLWVASSGFPTTYVPLNGFGITITISNGVLAATEFVRVNNGAGANSGYGREGLAGIGAKFKYRLERQANTTRFRIWDAAATEPTTWTKTSADATALPAGQVGYSVRSTATVANALAVDDITIYDFATAPTTPTTPTGTGVEGETVYAATPPTGLAAVAANGTDDAAKLQAILTYVKSSYGAGEVRLPHGKTVTIGSGITIPAGVRLTGDATSIIRYTPTTGTAITINDGSATPLTGFKLTGPGQTGNTATGINIKGARMTFRDLEVRYFNRGISVVNSDTYILDFNSCRMGNCGTIIWADVAGKSGSAGVSNSGERLLFTNCLFDNSGEVIYASENGPDVVFIGCSLDFCRSYGTFWDLVVRFIGCHIESAAGTTNPYLFTGLGNPKLHLTSTYILMGGQGVYHVMNPANAPYNFGNGNLRMTDSTFYWGNGPAGAGGGNITSEQIVPVASGATSVTVTSPWISAWSAARVSWAGMPGQATPATAPQITVVDNTARTITVTFPALSAGALLSIDW